MLWDVPGRKRLASDPLLVSEGAVRSLSFSPDGRTLASGYRAMAFGISSDNGGVVLWDTAARRRLTDEPLRVPEGRGAGFLSIPTAGHWPRATMVVV